jgi:hemerythrin-like metal-binding protein
LTLYVKGKTMLIELTDEVLTGIEEIDSGNIELLNKTNELLKAIKLGRGDEEVDELIRYLDTSITEHFSREEEILMEYAFPDFGCHIAQHSRFLDEFNGIKSKFYRDGANFSISIDITNMIINWLGEHVCEKDRKFASLVGESSLEVSV